MDASRRRRIAERFWIAIFLLLVFVPALQQYVRVVPVTPVVEARPKVPAPDGNPIVQLWLGGDYFANYERHVNDVFGFRDLFIRLRNQIQFSLFRDSDQVVVGTGGWLTDRSAVEVEQRAVDNLSDASWATLRRRVELLDRRLRQRGIYLVVVPVPLKNTVYPEHFPQIAQRRPAVTGYERFRRMLAASHVPFVDAYRVLEERKRTADVYYHTDLHWNTFGARAVAAETVRMLAQHFHTKVAWRYDDRYTVTPFSGGVENAVLATIWPVPDVEPFEDSPAPCGPIEHHGPYDEYTNHCAGPTLPPAMLVGNSFSLQMIGDGLPQHFVRMDLTSDLSYFDRMLAMIRPGTRIVIWQLFELEIGYQLQGDGWWNQLGSAR